MISRLAKWWRSHRGAVLVASVVAAALVIAVAFIWPVTDLIAAHDVGRIAGAQGATQLQTAREAVRTQLLTLAAGVFVAGALWFTAQNFRLSRQSQVTDRYTKAIEQLGSDKLDVRIGGIYALERVARDSARDHPTVMEVLTAFVREHSREQGPLPETDHAPARTRPDVQAALTVIGRRDATHDRQRIDLMGANLTAARLTGADLAGASLHDADLTRAHLTDADLRAAWLIGTNCFGALLMRSTLAGAYFGGTDLTGANLEDADLTDVRCPPLQPVPAGWLRDPDSGRLKRADLATGDS